VVERKLEIFEAETKIAVNFSSMAADAGGIEPGEKAMACAGTMPETRYYSGHKATFTTDLLKNLRPGKWLLNFACASGLYRSIKIRYGGKIPTNAISEKRIP
jgi:hypothetical protein